MRTQIAALAFLNGYMSKSAEPYNPQLPKPQLPELPKTPSIVTAPSPSAPGGPASVPPMKAPAQAQQPAAKFNPAQPKLSETQNQYNPPLRLPPPPMPAPTSPVQTTVRTPINPDEPKS